MPILPLPGYTITANPGRRIALRFKVRINLLLCYPAAEECAHSGKLAVSVRGRIFFRRRRGLVNEPLPGSATSIQVGLMAPWQCQGKSRLSRIRIAAVSLPVTSTSASGRGAI